MISATLTTFLHLSIKYNFMGKLIVLFLVVGLLGSCSKDKNDEDLSLQGNWILTDVMCFCGPSEEDLSKYTLQFDVKKSTVTIVNGNKENSGNEWLESGTFSFTLENNIIRIEGSPDGIYEIKGNVLQMSFDPIPAAVDDEFTLMYKKG